MTPLSSRTHLQCWPSGRTSPRASKKIGGCRAHFCPSLGVVGSSQGGALVQIFFSIFLVLPSSNLDSYSVLCRILIAGTNSSNLGEILHLLSIDNNLLLTSSYLASPNHHRTHTNMLITQYLNATENRWCSWSVSCVAVGSEEAFQKEVLGGGGFGGGIRGSPVCPFL